MSKAKKQLLKQTGTTEDHMPVYAGAFEVHDQAGVPLAIVCDYFYDHSWRIDWLAFVDKALSCNWNKNTIASKIREALIDSKFTPEHANVVHQKINDYLGL